MDGYLERRIGKYRQKRGRDRERASRYKPLRGIGHKHCPEGPDIQLLGNQAPKYRTIEGILGPNSLMVVYVDPLGWSSTVHSSSLSLGACCGCVGPWG